jgi:hypothetical protein
MTTTHTYVRIFEIQREEISSMHPLTSSISTIALVVGLEWSGQGCIEIGVCGIENGGRYLVYADEKVLTCGESDFVKW